MQTNGSKKKNTWSQRAKTLEQRFWEKVDKSGYCWEWKSAIGSRGYGVFWVGGKRRNKFAHRVAWELEYGFEPNSTELVCHICDNPKCVNPSHLFLGSHLDNALDSSAKGRKPRGEENKGGGKLRKWQVVVIKNRVHSIREASALFGVSMKTIKMIRKGSLWKHV